MQTAQDCLSSKTHTFVKPPAPHRPEQPVLESRTFYDRMSTRRSIRSFSSEPVPKDILLNAIRTAGTAPSGANLQPWFFALIESPEMKREVRLEAEKAELAFYREKAPQEWLSDLAPLGTGPVKDYLEEAPALIAVFSRHRKDGIQDSKSYYPLESTGIAVGLLLASLHNAGLATLTHTPRPMEFLREVAELDSSYRPFMIVVAGHAAPEALVPEIRRKPLTEICRVF